VLIEEETVLLDKLVEIPGKIQNKDGKVIREGKK
jgi:hypothetical protein